MKIQLNTRYSIAELEVTSGNTTITEDVAVGYSDYISSEYIENLVSVANDMSRFNKVSDVDFVKNIINAFLNDSERVELIEQLQSISK